MENMVEDSDGSALDYAQAFMDIGEETGVSRIILHRECARSRD